MLVDDVSSEMLGCKDCSDYTTGGLDVQVFRDDWWNLRTMLRIAKET